MQEMKPIKEGKVREIYDNGDSLIMVATDRISCFDVILNNEVTKKGAVLTQMSKFWFDMTEDIIPNHMISVDMKDMPEFFQQEKFNGNSMMCRKLEMLPIECIVRGYITGSGWESYKKTGKVCIMSLQTTVFVHDRIYGTDGGRIVVQAVQIRDHILLIRDRHIDRFKIVLFHKIIEILPAYGTEIVGVICKLFMNFL